MLDYQRIVDELRNSLYSASHETVDFVRAAAADYALACEEINERLRRCDTLLKQGLRSEAIQQAEIEPVLLNLVATLDIPEREQWTETIDAFGIAAPPPLMMEVAAELNEAYALEQPLAAQLARHRLLALARSPLRDRISVLRKLANLDSGNPVWREDLLAFERERQRQMKNELGSAVNAGDLATVTALDEELQESEWLETPPAKLGRWASENRQRLAARQARTELEELERALNDAFSGFDIDAGRRLRRRWEELDEIAQLIETDPLAERTAPAFEWLAEEDRKEGEQSDHHEAVASLEHALEAERPRGDLENLHRLATRHGHELPAHLMSLYHSRLEALHLTAGRRWRLLLTVVVLTAVLISVAVAMPVYYLVQSRQVAAQAETLIKLIDEGKLKEADAFVARLTEHFPEMANDPRLTNLVVRLVGLEKDETERQEALRVALAAAVAGGVDQPDIAALHRAEQLAKTDSERAQVMSVRSKIDAAKHSIQKEHEKSFLDSLKAFAAQLAELEKNSPMTLAERRQAIEDLQNDVNALVRESEEVSSELLHQAKPLSARLELLSRAVRGEMETEAHEVTITRAIGDREVFRSALVHYMEQFPDGRRTAGFRRVVAEAPIWQQVESWNQFLEHWQPQVTAASGPTEATELVNAINSFCNQNPHWFRNGALKRRVLFFEAITRRTEDDQPIQDALIELFKDQLVADVWLVELKTGNRLYARHQPTINDDGFIQAQFLSSFDFKERPRVIKRDELKRAPSLAPQVTLAKEVRPLLNKLTNDNWDESFVTIIGIVSKVNLDGPQIEPLLRLRLLQQTIEVGAKGSHCFELALESQLKTLHRSKISPTANWLDPDNAEANDSRVQAERELAELGSFKTLKDSVAKFETGMRASLGKRLIWVGWLRSKSDDHFGIAFNSSPPTAGELYVVTTEVNGTISLVVVGHVTADGLNIDGEKNKAALVDGRPVFIALP